MHGGVSMPDFQTKLKQLRIESGLTQKQLAESLNVSQNAVYNWENGKREPSLDMIKKIAKTFDIALYVLLDDEYQLPDINSESWKKRARFVGDTEMVKCPHFTVPSKSEYTIQININKNNPLNIALKKLDNGEPLTPEESQLIKEYINSDMFREKLAQLPAHFKKLADSIKRNYDLLNAEGQKEADRQVELANKQIELLTKIPEYRKKPDDIE